MGGDSSWQDQFSDPLRYRVVGSAEEFRNHAPPRVEEVKNDLCTVKLVMMHRPTHEPEREKTGEYPFSWHLADKKRLWELRLQVKFHQPPRGRMFFGVELDKFVPVSGVAKQAQKALVSACKGVVGDCYHSIGDAPDVQGEREAPAFVMPLWAFDHFHVADLGREPPLTADLSGLGFSRAEGVSKYISAMKAVISSFSTDKVYTFSFWGVSRFLDIIKWRVIGGLLPGVKLDFNQLCGSPPVYVTFYELQGADDDEKDKRHLRSRKNEYFRASVWSTLRPPSGDGTQPSVESPVANVGEAGASDYWSSMYGEAGQTYEHPKPADSGAVVGDLLGLDDFAGTTAQQAPVAPLAAQQPPPKAENTDLLGLF